MSDDEPHIEIPNDPNVSPQDIEPKANLSGANLTDAYLVGADLTGADLEGADLTDARLQNADLNSANLKRADFTNVGGADLSGAELTNTDLSGVGFLDTNLSGAFLRNADLTGAMLNKADLSGAELIDADLTNAHLRYADLSGANLRDADLPETDLRDTDFYRARLISADLSNANLQGANLFAVRLWSADISDAILRDADLRDAHIEGADLSEVFLEQADLTWARLQDVNLSGANLDRADLTNADLSDATLTDADLTKANITATNFDRADLSGASLKSVGFDSLYLFEIPSDWIATADLLGSVPSLIEPNVDWRDKPAKEYFKITVPGTGKPASFVEAELRRVELEGANLNSAELNEAALTAADCENVQFKQANLQRATLENADLSGADFSKAYIYQTRFDGAQINQETQFYPDGEVGDTRTNNACRYDSKVRPKTSAESIAEEVATDSDTNVDEIRARRARSTYTRLERLASENGFPNLKSEMFIRRQDARRELFSAQSQTLKRWFAQLQKWVFNYGESFRRIIMISVATIILSWLAYIMGGIVATDDGTPIDFAVVLNDPVLIYDTLLNSVLVFFSGNRVLETTNRIGEGIVVAESMVGPILIALLIFVLGRRAAR